MENNSQKCSALNHKENEAFSFCQECKIYMCNKCENHHSELFQNHHQFKIDKNKNMSEIFTGLCKEKNHPYELRYFCKNHNKLCCAECITKIKGKDYGQHMDCNVCIIEEIELEKKNKLKENIKCLEELSSNLEQSINELKIIFEKIEKNKEKLKINIQKIFTKLRNILNDRENKLLLDVDNIFDEIFSEKNIIKETEKLPNKIKVSLENGKLIDNNIEKQKNLNSFINDCLNIENNIKEINKINMSIKTFNSKEYKIEFIHSENEIKLISEKISNFGGIFNRLNSQILKE